ncbi:recombinase family protein [Micromonospora peucetia]|uniref:Recombinase family protein n=1 Tax=Micromonospora peucetia TaxID=47871 RepID=A0ABZ1EN22_9ACTN|nr:recombinase family protein [Micromonospora peucetia]WSA35630.1 recombinase family protein [Micromonospora peucetia]
MDVAVYTRISEDRTGEQAGVTDQLKDTSALAAARGWAVAGRYTDNDISAHSGSHRPGYEDLMRDVASGKYGAIIVWHTSRLWRNRRERADGIELLRAHRVSVISVKGPELDLSHAYGRMVAGILGEFDTTESEIKSERVSRAALRRAEQGLNHGGTRAFGYAHGGMALEPAEAAEVANMFSSLLAGVPLGRIVQGLNDRRVRTVRGGEWMPGTVRDLLMRPRYAGLSEHRGTIVGKGRWPAIITEHQHHAAVALLSDPSRRMSTGNRAAYLLSGIAKCGVCGGNITSGGLKRADPNLPGGRRVYVCRSKKHVGRRQDWVDAYVSAVMVQWLSRDDAAGLLVDDNAPNADALRDEAHSLRLRLDAVATQFADDVIDLSQLRTASKKLRDRLEVVQRAQQHVGRTPLLGQLIGAGDVQAAWDGLDLDRRRAVVETLATVVLHPGGSGRRTFDPTKVQIVPKG